MGNQCGFIYILCDLIKAFFCGFIYYGSTVLVIAKGRKLNTLQIQRRFEKYLDNLALD